LLLLLYIFSNSDASEVSQAMWNITPCCSLIIGCAIDKMLTNAQSI